MTTLKEPKKSSNYLKTDEPNYDKLITPVNSPNVLISPLNKKIPDPFENLTTVEPPSKSTIYKKPKMPEWKTLKSLNRNTVVDMKPYKKARSLNPEIGFHNGAENSEKPGEETRKNTMFYLKKFANMFKKTPSSPLKNRGNSRSFTTKIYPEMKRDEIPLETVNDEDEDRYDIDLFDKEILMENTNKLKNKEEIHQLYERLQHAIKLEDEDYVYQNTNDSDEENDNNNKKFKLMDSGLMYEKELFRVTNLTDPFYSLYAEKKNMFEMHEMYSDSFPFLKFRKKILYVKCLISYFFFFIIKTKTFEAISLLVIVWNTIMLIIDPNSDMEISNYFDQMFLYLYTAEMGFKIIALGFILNENAYLRDYWNILDFTIITTGYIPYVLGADTGVNLTALRSLRVLRPLRTISTIKALRTILVTLFSALPLILSSVMVNLFFLLIFAIAGLQLFQGLLKRRCFNVFTGLILAQPLENSDPMINGVMCGYDDCPDNYVCGRLVSNPNFDIINFDTIFYSFLMIFQCITLEGWTTIMNYVIRSFSIYTIVFFIVLVWIGAYFLVNLTLAVISTKFKEAQDHKNDNKIIIEDDEEEGAEVKVNGPSIEDIRNLKLCEKAHHKRSLRIKGGKSIYGANEEFFKKDRQDELRWDDLLELKERILEEKERADAEENFNKIRDQELEGSNYKKVRRKKNDLRYLPKAKIKTGKNTLPMQKMVHKSKKLRFMAIQGVNHEKSLEKSYEKNNSQKSPEKVKNSPGIRASMKMVEKSPIKIEVIAEKTDEETMQLINLNEEELFLQEFSKKAENFIEIKQDQINISCLRKKPRIFKKQPSILQEKPKSKTDINKTHESLKNIHTHEIKKPGFQRKSTTDYTNILSFHQNNEKRPSLQTNNQFLESQMKFRESMRINSSNTHMKLKDFSRKNSKKLTKKNSKISRMTSFSEDEVSNLESTILNDSDFNIAGFEKPARNKSLTLIPIQKLNEISPSLRPLDILHPILPANRFQNAIVQAIENKKKKSLIRGTSIEENQIPKTQENKSFKVETETKKTESPIENPNEMKNEEENSLIKEVSVQKVKKIVANSANSKENKGKKEICATVSLNQTDPEGNNIDDTDQEMRAVKNESVEQISTRTFINSSKNTIEKESKGWKLFRTLTLLKKKVIEKNKEDIEKMKKIQLQKKYNVLHFKLMINAEKAYESNSTDEVLETRHEILKIKKRLAFEKEVKSQRNMPIEYHAKLLNYKKLDKKRKDKEKQLLRQLEKKRQECIDYQSLREEEIIFRILKIPISKAKLPLRIHKNLLSLIMKQRSALFGNRDSRSKVTSSLSPTSRNLSMILSNKGRSKMKKRKRKTLVIKYDYDILKENLKEKLYDSNAINEQITEFQFEQVYEQIWLKDFKKGVKKDYYRKIKLNLRWSGEDICDFRGNFITKKLALSNDEPFSLFKIEKIQKKINKMTAALSSVSYDKQIWLSGLKGKFLMVHKYIRSFVNSRLFDHTMLICVLLNTAILAMDGLFYDQTTVDLLDNFNLFCTMIFTVELALKLVSESPKRFLADKMNIFDGFVVVISQVELWALSGTKGLSAFRTVRIFRTFRVLRVTRLLRSLEFMGIIINVIARCIDSLIYIGLLLLLLNVIYALIGIQIFMGNLNNREVGIRQNFDSFNDAFLTVYQLMTVENWNDILTVTMTSNVGAGITCFYLISWIFIGNYVFLNLILAILLEGFSEEWENQRLHADDDEFEDIEEKERERKQKEQQEKEQEMRIQGMEAEELERELLSKTKKFQQKPLYEGVFCQSSLYFFNKTNIFRKNCYMIVHSNYFESFILFLIVLSSFKLAIDTYLSTDDENVILASAFIDNTFNVLFGIEFVLKVIAFGFFMDHGSYLRDSWNQLDFVIVVSSLIDMSVASINVPFIKILRLLRTLRPLRFISHNVNMKIVVTALMESAGPIANVSIVVLLIFLMFSIFGMSMMQDRFGYCDYNYSNINIFQISITQCEAMGGVWRIKEDNYDNIFRAMLTIFIISTQENWPILMYDAVDSNTSEIGPVQNSVPLFSYFYVVCLFVCNIFLINLFVGVIFMNFIEATNSTNPYHSIFLTQEQERWLDFQKMIAIAKTDFKSYILPQNKYRKKVNDIVNDKYFEVFIMLCIMFNIVTMALVYDGCSALYQTVLESINYFFTSVFIIECTMKFIGMGVQAYFYSAWNRFDLFVVASSIIDLLMSTIGTSLFSFLRVGPQLARILRVLRVSRLLKLVKSLKGIQKLLETLILALPSLMNVGALLLLVYFIFSVLGVFLFQDITTGVAIDDLNNFNNFTFAMILLFRCSTGESWWLFMFDTYKFNPYAPLFWIPFIVICSFIMLNLFILVILDEFEKYTKKGDSPRSVFKEAIIEFRKNWSALTRATKGKRMQVRMLIDFFKMLNPPIGFGKEARREMVAKEIMKMNITGDENNNVYFNEVLYGALKRSFGDLELTKKGRKEMRVKLSPNTQKLITQEELLTKKNIEKMKRDIIKKEQRSFRSSLLTSKQTSSFKQHSLSVLNSDMKSSNSLLDDNKGGTHSALPKKKNYLNPLVTLLFVGMTFKSWWNFQKGVKKGEIINDYNFSEPSSGSDDEEISHHSQSFLDEDEFNEEEQKEYEKNARKPKAQRKNLLDYEESENENNNNESEEDRNIKSDIDEKVLVDNERKQLKKKPILKNHRMSAFGEMPQRKMNMRLSLKPEKFIDDPNLISEERNIINDGDSK